MDNQSLGKQLTQLIAAVQILFDDFNFNFRVFQKLGQIIGNLAAADKHGRANGCCINVNLAEKLGGLFRRTNKGYFVSCLHPETSVRNHNIVFPFYSADQHVAVKLCRYFQYLHVMKNGISRNMEFQKLHTAFCKGIDLNG